MPTCIRCADGSVICGNPPPPCNDGTGVETLSAGPAMQQLPKLDRIEVDVYEGALRVTTSPRADLGNPSRLVIEYDAMQRVIFRFA